MNGTGILVAEHAGLGAEAFLLPGREPALGSRWPFAGMTGPKFGRVNEMKKVTPYCSRRLRWSLSEADSMELVGVPGTDSRESVNSADDDSDEGRRLYNAMMDVDIDKADRVFWWWL
ncbi:uncharacterized protein ARMOST_02114 [Armillaria ostoyae]|uniref:Uncharacterized protein n=1 Tax=Armillaria ostoyae TaxID=47428 RepID=A0A284QQT0_ARMOS|nr:uncharacterized protein ARMOST_02114 [Armillaria ostoyae]